MAVVLNPPSTYMIFERVIGPYLSVLIVVLLGITANTQAPSI
jgi:hypothetical protein